MRHLSKEQLALYAGGDLTRDESAAVEEHLGGCAECRAFVAEVQDSQALVFQSLGGPAAEELLSVRQSVFRHLQEQARATKGWSWAAAAAAVLIAGLFISRAHPPRARYLHSVATAYLRVPYRPSIQMSLPNLSVKAEPVRARRHVRAPGLRTVTLMAEDKGPPVLKMTTSDPDVVILWQLNERTRQ